MKAMAAALAATATAGLLVAAPASSAAPRADTPTVEGVPVLAQAWIGNVTDERRAVVSVHGVRRIEGATVVYYSLGLPMADATGGGARFSSYGNGNYYALTARGASYLVCDVAAIDLASGVAYGALPTGANRCVSTDPIDLKAPDDAPGTAPVGYTAISPVPDDVDTVDVLVGSALLQDVPVEDGPMEPAVEDPAPTVGLGWPTVDTAAIASSTDPEDAVFDLRTRVTDLEEEITTAEEKGDEQLDLDASVLFATDKATLTSKANAVISKAAKRITAAGTSGTITVTGHTDSNASDAYNLDLSKRRAAAVAKALKPKLPKGITIKTVGKGESEPIADNTTPEGRALNRRVTITLPK